MAVSFTQSGTQSFTATSGGVTLTGVAAGSVLIAVVQNLTSSVRTFTVDSGMSSQVSATNATNVGYRVEIFSSTSAGTGSVTVTATANASTTFRLTVYELAGADTTTPIEATGTENTSTSTTAPNLAASAVSYSAGSMIVGATSVNNGAALASFTQPSGFTSAFTQISGPAHYTGYGAQASSGSSQFAMVYGTSRPDNSCCVSVKQAAGGATSSRGDLMTLGCGV